MNKFSLFLKDAQNKGILNYFENHPLSSVSSIGTGGKARFFVTPYTLSALTDTVKAAYNSNTLYYVIGNATNILFPDVGYNGAVISTRKLSFLSLSNGLIYAECGVSLPFLTNFALKNALTGFEGLTSIPATVGGALVSNAGAFGSEIADNLVSFSVYLPQTDTMEERTPKDYPFSYRSNHAADGGAVILSADFSALAGDRCEIFAKMTESKERRKATQPMGVKSVGSFFKKPDYIAVNKDVSPLYYGKSAGELIELCGLKRKTVGGAAVSEMHAGFLVNLGDALTSDFLSLSEEIKKTVFEKTGVRLCEECVIPRITDEKQNKTHRL